MSTSMAAGAIYGPAAIGKLISRIKVTGTIASELNPIPKHAPQQHNHITRCIYRFLSVIRERIS